VRPHMDGPSIDLARFWRDLVDGIPRAATTEHYDRTRHGCLYYSDRILATTVRAATRARCANPAADQRMFFRDVR